MPCQRVRSSLIPHGAALYERQRFAFERVCLGYFPLVPQAPDMPRPLRYRQTISTDGTQSAAAPSTASLCGVVRRQRLARLRLQEAIENALDHGTHLFKGYCHPRASSRVAASISLSKSRSVSRNTRVLPIGERPSMAEMRTSIRRGCGGGRGTSRR
jgi:hypothetical protein